MVKMAYDEWYGHVPHTLLLTIKRHNVSPADFIDLQDALGRTDWPRIEACIKELTALNDGFYNPRYTDIERWGWAH